MPGPEGYTPEDIIEASGKVKDPAETVDDKKEKKVNTSTNKRAAGDDKFVVAIGEASEVAAKRRSYDMRQEIRLQEQHESSLSRFKKLKKLGSDLAHGRIKEVMAISHADEYANQQRNENFLLAGSELARTSLEQARLASRRELAALAEQVKEDGEAKTDPGLEAEVNSLIAQYATAEPPMSDEDFNTAKLQFLENVRIKFPKEYEKTRLFAENIHDVAISVRDAYETNKSIVTGDRVNNLILKLGGSVAGGFETDANKDLIVKGYNIMARHKDGKLGKFVNPYTVGLGIFLGTKAAQLGRKASIVAPVIGAGLIGGLKGYVNAETDMADTTLDMATGKMAPGAAPASSFKQKMSYVAGHIPEARRQEMVVSQEKISDLTSNIETLTEAVKSLENGAERREKIEQLRKVMADGQARMDVGLESSRDLFVYDDENSIDSNRQSLLIAISSARTVLSQDGIEGFHKDLIQTDLDKRINELREEVGDKRAKFKKLKLKMAAGQGVKYALFTFVLGEAIELGLSNADELYNLVKKVVPAGIKSDAIRLVVDQVARGARTIDIVQTASAQEVLEGGATDTGEPGSPVDGISTPEATPEATPEVGATPVIGEDDSLQTIDPQGGAVFEGGATDTGAPGSPVDGISESEDGMVTSGSTELRDDSIAEGGTKASDELGNTADQIEAANAEQGVEEQVSAVSHEGNAETGDGTGGAEYEAELVAEEPPKVNAWESIQDRIEEVRDASRDTYITHGTDLVGEHNELGIEYKVEADRIVIDVTNMETGVDFDGDGHPDIPEGTQLYGVFYLTEADHAAGREIRVPFVDGKLVLEGENKDLAELFAVENGEVTQQFERFSVASDNGDGSFTFHASNEGKDITESVINSLKDVTIEQEVETPEIGSPVDGVSEETEDAANYEVSPPNEQNPNPEVPPVLGDQASPQPPFPESSTDYVGYPEGVVDGPEVAPAEMPQGKAAEESTASNAVEDFLAGYVPIYTGRGERTPIVPVLFENKSDEEDEEKIEIDTSNLSALALAKFAEKKRPLTPDEIEFIDRIIELDELPVAEVARRWKVVRGTRDMVHMKLMWKTMNKAGRKEILSRWGQLSGEIEGGDSNESEVKLGSEDQNWIQSVLRKEDLTEDEVLEKYPELEGSEKLKELIEAWPSFNYAASRRRRLEPLILEALTIRKANEAGADETEAATKAEELKNYEYSTTERNLSTAEKIFINDWIKQDTFPRESIERLWPSLKGTKDLDDIEADWFQSDLSENENQSGRYAWLLTVAKYMPDGETIGSFTPEDVELMMSRDRGKEFDFLNSDELKQVADWISQDDLPAEVNEILNKLVEEGVFEADELAEVKNDWTSSKIWDRHRVAVALVGLIKPYNKDLAAAEDEDEVDSDSEGEDGTAGNEAEKDSDETGAEGKAEKVFKIYERGPLQQVPESLLDDLREVTERTIDEAATDEEKQRFKDIISDEIEASLPFLEDTKQLNNLLVTWMNLTPDQRLGRLRKLAEFAPVGTFGSTESGAPDNANERDDRGGGSSASGGSGEAGGSRGGGSSEGRNENSNNATANVYVESGREQALQIPPELYEVLNTSTREAHETARKAIDSSKEFGELSLKMIQESRRAETERAVSPEMVELIAKVDAQGETIQFLSTLLAQALASKAEKVAQLQSPETSPDNVINIVNELSIDEGLIDQLGLIIHQSMGEFNQRLTDLESRAQSSGNTSPVVINNINEVRQVADQTLENVTKVINQPGPTSVDIRQRLQLTRPMPRVNSRDLNGRRRPSRVRTSEPTTESAPGPQPVAEGWADPLEKPAKGAKWWYVENAGGIYNSDMPKKGVEKGDAKSMDDVRQDIVDIMESDKDFLKKYRQSESRRRQFREKVGQLVDEYIQRWQAGQSTAEERYAWIEQLRSGELTKEI